MTVKKLRVKVRTKTGIIYSFTATIDRNPDFIRFTLGSPRMPRPCVDIYLEDAEGTACILEDFVYDKLCAESNDLRRGPDGSIVMLQTALHILHRCFPNVKTTELSDKSYIGRTSLTHYYLLKSGHTWYQKWFDAYPTYSTEKKQILLIREKINKIVNITYESFLRESHMVDAARLKTLYTSALNKSRWRSLFDQISNEESIRPDYMKCIPHIFRMLDLPNMVATSWSIRKTDIETLTSVSMSVISINEIDSREDTQTGGKLISTLDDIIYMYGGAQMHAIRAI